MKSNRLTLSAFVALAAMLSVSPAVAQKGHGNGHGRGHDDRDRTEVRREDRREDRRDDSRFERRSSVPRGWCQGTGNPHNTARNCGYRGSMDGLYRDRSGVLRDRNGRVIMSDGRVYDERNRVYSRSGNTSGTYRNGTYGNSNGSYNGGSYEAAHQQYHSWHDQQCRERSAQIRNIADRLRVAGQCKAEHDEWHRQQGTRH